MKARNRPPRLEAAGAVAAAGVPAPPPPAPTPAEQLVHAKVAGPARMGSREQRSLMDRLAHGDRGARGALEPLGVNGAELWAAVAEVFGTDLAAPAIDPACTLRAAARAGERLRAAAALGGRVAFATASPATMLGAHLALAGRAAAVGAEVPDEPDSGPLRIDGRRDLFVRWLDGVAVASDGASLFGVTGPDAATEWLFLLGRPMLVVADGPFAEVAWSAGLDVVAFTGLERPALAVASARGEHCTVVPVHPGRSPRAYSLVAALVTAGM